MNENLDRRARPQGAGTVFYDDDGNLVATGDESDAAFAAHLAEVQEHNRQALAQLKPHELARLETWLRTHTHATPPVRPHSRPSGGRAPREARNDRPRGSRRSSARRSSERSGDSGSEDGESEPSRTCSWCGTAIDHLNADAEYCGAKHRVYAQRDRDRLQPERVPERRLVLLAESGARPPVRCKCDPKRGPVDEGVCVPCGRARGLVAVAWLSEARDLRSKQLVARAPARRNPRYKRKPVREWVDETIVRRVAT